jgi:DNA-binding transcriptional MerR regulator
MGAGKMKNKMISAKEIVKRFKIRYHTINYYTMIGLFPLIGKNGNQRLYEEKQIRLRLRKIAKLSKEGYPLQLIRKKLLGV